MVSVPGGCAGFKAGITDSFGSRLAPLRDGLGFLKGAFCPHYDSEQGRQPMLQCELRMGFPSTIAADDGVGLLFRRHPGCGGGFFTASCARLLGSDSSIRK